MTRLMNMPEVGDKLRMVNSVGWGGRKVGDIFEVISVHVFKEFVVVTDDDGADLRVLAEHLRDFELVPETAQSIADLIANIGRRLSEVETELERSKERKFYGDMVEAYSDLDGEPEVDEGDAVNSPQHYKRGKYETIEVIEHITAGYDNPFVAYCVGNAVKYIDRAPYKHDSPAECLRKAAWYITRAAEQAEASE